jgi:predicted TPR repeat methyltransferase
MNIDEIKDIYSVFSKTYEKEVKHDMNYTAYIRVPGLVLKHLHTTTPRILDLGCGTGLSSLPFFKNGYEVTGIDASRAMIERARRLPYKKLLCQNLEKSLRVRDQSFDAVVMVGVMEYLDDPAVVFRQVRKKLVDAGIFGLTVPQKSSWYSESDLASYYRKEIEPIMKGLGFAIVDCEKIVGVEDFGRRAYYRNYLVRKA